MKVGECVLADNKNISIKKATIINAGSKYVTVIWNLILTAILTRLLTPGDYGIFLRQETLIPEQWKPTFRIRKPHLIGLTTIHKK